MTIRFRAASAAPLVLLCGLSVAAAGCGKYSISSLKASKAFKDANQYYQAKEYKKAADRYEDVVQNQAALQQAPVFNIAYFFLANCYDQLYKPAKNGDPQNDAYIQKAIENYRKAADNIADQKWKKSSLEYLASAYGADKLNEPANYMAIAQLYEDAGRYEEAEAQLQRAKEVKPNDASVYTALAAFYNRQGDFDKTIDALTQAANLAPNNPEGWHLIATYYWDKARKDYRLSDAEKKDFILKGIAMDDKALSLNPNYLEAMTYKNILLRMQANTEKDPKKQKDLLNQADELRNKVLDAQKRKATGKG
jgi:predicted Zn-dependent protease